MRCVGHIQERLGVSDGLSKTSISRASLGEVAPAPPFNSPDVAFIGRISGNRSPLRGSPSHIEGYLRQLSKAGRFSFFRELFDPSPSPGSKSTLPQPKVNQKNTPQWTSKPFSKPTSRTSLRMRKSINIYTKTRVSHCKSILQPRPQRIISPP